MKRVQATVKKLKQLARAMSREADICQRAANLCVDNALHKKNAATWRGRARTCWRAVGLLQETQR